MNPPVEPRYFARDEGRTYRLGRLRLVFKAVAADTGGAYTLCETFEPEGGSAALHRHGTYDETHIICAGNYACQMGERMLQLGPGEMMFVRRGKGSSSWPEANACRRGRGSGRSPCTG